MPSIRNTFEVAAASDVAFGYASDLRNARDWMYGIQDIHVVGDIDTGPGATYRGTVKLGVPIRSTIVITEWEPGSRFTSESRSGFANTMTWRFADLGNGRTQIVVTVDYQMPGGLVGRAMAAAVDPFIALTVKHAERSISVALTDCTSRRGAASDHPGH